MHLRVASINFLPRRSQRLNLSLNQSSSCERRSSLLGFTPKKTDNSQENQQYCPFEVSVIPYLRYKSEYTHLDNAPFSITFVLNSYTINPNSNEGWRL